MLSGVITFYGVVQKQFRRQTALLELSDHSRIAEQLWMTVIRSKKTTISPYYYKDAKPGTDAFTIDYVDTLGEDVLFDMQDHTVVYTTSSHKFSVNDDLMISDCKSVEFFKVKNAVVSNNEQKIITDKPLNKMYKKFSEVNSYQHESYYIGSTQRFDNHHQVINALYRINKKGKKTEIIEGINDMKIGYSVLKEGVMIDQPILYEDETITGVAISLKHVSLIEPSLSKKQYSYVAIR